MAWVCNSELGARSTVHDIAQVQVIQRWPICSYFGCGSSSSSTGKLGSAFIFGKKSWSKNHRTYSKPLKIEAGHSSAHHITSFKEPHGVHNSS
ncbi:hypothetical protein N7510_003481 [Penicillium lagena]|uniref:uncharacterized protein n=1 Tax=Penicillium lagena TaxID=94218 RepID=UPI00253F7794|nr:uncharacterized protein N7510_003481 [Penicillium lagena]KAJ5619497.1 hypothetical protein N7510_003481 [Penicillium lagena]